MLALISLIAITTPLFLGGISGTEITGDLDAEAAHLEWSVNRSAEVPDDAEQGSSLRGVWRNQQGLEVWARARPFLPFEGLEAARDRYFASYRARKPLDIGRQQLGPHEVIRVVERLAPEAATEPQSPMVRLEYLLLDGRGRDTHTLSTDVAEPELAQADAQLQQLIRCMFWIDAYR